jgi:AraC family transcriptional regulator, ethanolamine operon transcriptional activator
MNSEAGHFIAAADVAADRPNGRSGGIHGGTNVVRVAADDADDLAEKAHHWGVRLTQLHPGPFSGRIAMISLGPLLVCRAMYSRPVLQNLMSPADCITVTRMTARSDPLACRGRDVGPGECFLFGPGAEGEAVNRGIQYPTTVSIPLSLWHTESHWLNETDLPRTRGMHVPEPGEAWIAGFLQRVEWILDAVERIPEAAGPDDVRAGMADSLLAYVNTLGETSSSISNDRETRAHRRVAVERARVYISENLADPIRLADLCRVAHTQARSLEYGFQELLSMSPVTYIRTMRLHRARRLLRSSVMRTRSISEIALDCGFWHLSQFSADYKILFGEKPSVTLKRTMAQLPRSERRREPEWKQASRSSRITSLC